jgi:hypothetical protein
VKLNFRYDDFRPMDTVIWSPKRSFLKRCVGRALGREPDSVAAVYLTSLQSSGALYFVCWEDGRCTVSDFPDHSLESAERAHVVRPRGAGRKVAETLHISRAAKMAAEAPEVTAKRWPFSEPELGASSALHPGSAKVLALWNVGFALPGSVDSVPRLYCLHDMGVAEKAGEGEQ